MAEEYVEVIYKLLESSWRDDAVVNNLDTKVFADPEGVRYTNHVG